MKQAKSKNKKLPRFFKPLFWWCDFSDIDPKKHRQIVIVQAVNYGQRRHWRWVIRHYKSEEIKHVVATLPVTTFRPQDLRRFAELTGIKKFNYAPRAVKPKIRNFPPADYNWFSTSFEEILKKSETQAKNKK